MRNQPPQHTRNVLKGVLSGIEKDDLVLLWNSGIYGWLDATTLVHAMHLIRGSHPNVKLVLLGVGNISGEGKGIPERFLHAKAREALAAGKQLGVLDKNVFFVFDRVPAEDVANYLLEADIGVATYPDSLETRLCIGTRLFDFVWAELPIVTSSSPLLEEFVSRNRIGLTVSCGDPNELAAAIEKLADDRQLYANCKANLRILRKAMTWEVLTEPLVEYCQNLQHYPRPRKGRRWRYLTGQLAFVFYTALIKAYTRSER